MINELCNRFELYCQRTLEESLSPGILKDAISYSILDGGKRLRPLLVYTLGLDLALDLNDLDAAALAVEYIHTYSLIHDDLPAMDDDAMRRGKASCHIKFGEATAILAGDCLQNLAFGILSKECRLTSKQQLQMLQTLHSTTGADGLVGGQILDLGLEKLNKTPNNIEKLHLLKTAKLFEACIAMPCIVANLDTNTRLKLQKIGINLGIAFQIQDDIADFDQDIKFTNRFNYACNQGIDHSIARINTLLQEIEQVRAQLKLRTENLTQLQQYILPSLQEH